VNPKLAPVGRATDPVHRMMLAEKASELQNNSAAVSPANTEITAGRAGIVLKLPSCQQYAANSKGAKLPLLTKAVILTRRPPILGGNRRDIIFERPVFGRDG
jgi:hypothetical protein